MYREFKALVILQPKTWVFLIIMFMLLLRRVLIKSDTRTRYLEHNGLISSKKVNVLKHLPL